jgi:arylformamidase
MIIKINLGPGVYQLDTSSPEVISIPLRFNGAQPNTYNVEKANSHAYGAEGVIGDTRRGGSCNFEKYEFIPHCNGTHTEGVGHISYEVIPVNEILKELFIPSTLITVQPVNAIETNENYIPAKNENDMMITKSSLESLIKNEFTKGLVIRTLPNDDSKKSRNYMNEPPPYFSLEAIDFINSLGVEHLLVDMPSVDRMFDEGKLTVHHRFWNVKEGSHEVDRNKHSMKTITEFIYVPDRMHDGKYFISIHIPEFTTDAAPSRVMMYECI